MAAWQFDAVRITVVGSVLFPSTTVLPSTSFAASPLSPFRLFRCWQLYCCLVALV